MFAIGNSKWDRYNAILKYLYCIAVSLELVTDSLVHSRKGQEREINMKKILYDKLECKFVRLQPKIPVSMQSPTDG
jgi:hypothetical protein